MRALLLAAFALVAAPAAAQQTPVGRWMTADNGGVVALQPCSPGSDTLCGTVDGITGFQSNGAAPVDVQGRSRCHLGIISDLTPAEPGFWTGHITNPDDGKVYSIRVSVDPDGRLHMRGFIGIPLLGKTTIWTRYRGRLTPDCHLER
jgi:uncharacterized protein (DUF2147 family)